MKRTRLRPVSQKRRDEKQARDAVIEGVIFRDGPGCYAFVKINARYRTAVDRGWPLTCWHPTSGRLDAHEVIPRSVWPGGHLVVSNVRMVCRRHHEWIDANPTTASTLGLHGFSWGRVEEHGVTDEEPVVIPSFEPRGDPW